MLLHDASTFLSKQRLHRWQAAQEWLQLHQNVKAEQLNTFTIDADNSVGAVTSDVNMTASDSDDIVARRKAELLAKYGG